MWEDAQELRTRAAMLGVQCESMLYATFARMNFMVCKCARLQNS